MLSIGGNHLIHALRRNVNLKILMFNNQIYGLTKGQYSPTSEVGKVTKSTPFGSLDHPFNPISVALGAEATFVARTHDMDRKHMMEMFRRAHEHQGAAFVEVYQNCNVFNDGAFERAHHQGDPRRHAHRLEHGEPIRFGADSETGVVMNSRRASADRRRRRRRRGPILVHDESRDDPSLAFALSRLATQPARCRPRSACSAPSSARSTPTEMQRQLAAAQERGPRRPREAAALRRHLDRRIHQLLTARRGVAARPT